MAISAAALGAPCATVGAVEQPLAQGVKSLRTTAKFLSAEEKVVMKKEANVEEKEERPDHSASLQSLPVGCCRVVRVARQCWRWPGTPVPAHYVKNWLW
jgi:hypothetical protein